MNLDKVTPQEFFRDSSKCLNISSTDICKIRFPSSLPLPLKALTFCFIITVLPVSCSECR